jgi:hypothetical protein
MKDSFHEEKKNAYLTSFRSTTWEYCYEISNTKENIFKPMSDNERSHEISNDNGVRVIHLGI